MAKSHKVLVYVEGKSEVIFFKQYFNKYIKDNYDINIECIEGDITSFKRNIQRGLYFDYKEIFVLRDLKTEKKGYINYYCIENMKNDFTTKREKRFLYNIGRSYKFIVVSNEIESWALTYKRETNNRSECHYREMYTEFNCSKKTLCMKRYTDKLKKEELKFEINNNKSFKYFMDKLILCK